MIFNKLENQVFQKQWLSIILDKQEEEKLIPEE